MTDDTLREECWKPVAGYESRYLVSSFGNVKGLRYNSLLRLQRNEKGYLNIALWCNDAVKVMRVHRLVLEAFVGPCPQGHEGAHLDGNPGNNHLENLAWVTRAENHSHKKLHGTALIGERQHQSKLKDSQVLEIFHSTIPAPQICGRYNVSASAVRMIRQGVTWSHVTRKSYKAQATAREQGLP